MITYEYARASGLAEPVAPVAVAKNRGHKRTRGYTVSTRMACQMGSLTAAVAAVTFMCCVKK